MTSRDEWPRESTDPVDVMIRWVLREDVANVSPSPGMWERIRNRVVGRASEGERARSWSGFPVTAKDALLWLFDSPPALVWESGYCYGGRREIWEIHLHLLMYQGDLTLLGRLA